MGVWAARVAAVGIIVSLLAAGWYVCAALYTLVCILDWPRHGVHR